MSSPISMNPDTPPPVHKGPRQPQNDEDIIDAIYAMLNLQPALKSKRAKPGIDAPGDKRIEKVASQDAISGRVEGIGPEEGLQADKKPIRVPAASHPQMAPPGSSSPLPANKSGTQNPWLQPSLVAYLFMLILEVSKTLFETKLMEGKKSAEYIKESAQLSIQEGQAIIEKAQVEALQHLISAAMAFGTAAAQIGSSVMTLRAKAEANANVSKETELMKDNPNISSNKLSDLQPAERAKFKNDVDSYLDYKEKGNRGINPETNKPFESSLLKGDERVQYEQKLEQMRPGQKQLQEWIDRNGGNSPRNTLAQAERDSLRNEVNLRQNNPDHMEKVFSKEYDRIHARNRAISEVTPRITEGVKSLTEAFTSQKIAEYDQARVLLQGQEQALRTLMESSQNARRETSEILGEFTKWLLQISDTNSRVFSFRR